MLTRVLNVAGISFSYVKVWAWKALLDHFEGSPTLCNSLKYQNSSTPQLVFILIQLTLLFKIKDKMYLKFGIPAAECIPVHCNLNGEIKLCLTQTMKYD